MAAQTAALRPSTFRRKHSGDCFRSPNSPAQTPALRRIRVAGRSDWRELFVSRCESAAKKLRGAILHELASVMRGDLDHVVFMHDAAVGLDDRAVQHPHLPLLEQRKPGPSETLSARALRIEASRRCRHELKLTATRALAFAL